MIFSRPRYPQPFIEAAQEAPEEAHYMTFDQHYRSDNESYIVFTGFWDEEEERVPTTYSTKPIPVSTKSLEKFGRYGNKGHKIRVQEAMSHV